jgi:hypothetical protein
MYIVVALTAIVGAAVLTSNRNQKGRSSALSLSVAILGSALWVLFVQLFRSASDVGQAGIYLQIFSVCALLMPLGCLLYALSLLKHKALFVGASILATLVSLAVGGLILFNADMFCADIIMQDGANYATLVDGPLTLAFFSTIGIFFLVSFIMILVGASRSKSVTFRRGLYFLVGGLALSSLLSSTTSIVLPIIGYSELFWVGPLSVSVTMIFSYFITLRFKLFVNSSRFLQKLTYLVVVAVMAMIYTALFFLVFTLIFRGASPSDEILIFHFLMIAIVILLLPAINHLIESVKKIIADNSSVPKDQNETK